MTEEEIKGIAVILGVIVVCTIFWWKPVRDLIGVLKMKRQRRENLHEFYVGKLVGIVEDDIAEGHLTRQEAEDEIYTVFKRVFHTQKDLFPIPERKKAGIKKRLNEEVHAPVTLPDKKRKNLLGR